MNDNTASAVELHEVSKYFPRFTSTPVCALDQITLSIPAGSICGILGPNAAGKSVLMHLIGGLLLPTSGRISLNGHDLVHEREAALDGVSLGTLEAQLPDPQQTVAQALLHAEKTIAPLAHDMRIHLRQQLQTSLLWEQRDRVIAELSQGMQHRLAIICALLRAPTLLLLDEPTQTLDTAMTDMLAIYLRHLAALFGTTIVLATADTALAQMLCDNIAILRDGRLLTVQSVPMLLERYQTNMYQLRLAGQLDPHWQDWFDGMTITWEEHHTVLSGVIPDQAALHGIITRVRDLNLPLLSARKLDPDLHDIFEHLVQEAEGDETSVHLMTNEV